MTADPQKPDYFNMDARALVAMGHACNACPSGPDALTMPRGFGDG